MAVQVRIEAGQRMRSARGIRSMALRGGGAYGRGGPDDDVLGKAYDPRVMNRLMLFLQPYRRQIVFAFFVMILRAVSGLAGPYIIRLAIDKGISAGDTAFLGEMVMAYLAATGVNWITNFAQIYTMS